MSHNFKFPSEHGFATHFVPSRRIPALLERLAALDQPTFALIDSTIEEAHSEREPDEPVSPLVGELRIALDSAFRHDEVEAIVNDLKTISGEHKLAEVREWAKHTLEALDLRSPTSLKVALLAIRKGKTMSLLQALQMEMNFATAFCVSNFAVCQLYLRISNSCPYDRVERHQTSIQALTLSSSQNQKNVPNGSRRP